MRKRGRTELGQIEVARLAPGIYSSAAPGKSKCASIDLRGEMVTQLACPVSLG